MVNFKLGSSARVLFGAGTLNLLLKNNRYLKSTIKPVLRIWNFVVKALFLDLNRKLTN